MLPYIEFGNVYVSSYIFMAIVAFFVSTVMVIIRRKSQVLMAIDAFLLSITAMGGGILIAKLFYVVGLAIDGKEIWTLQFWQNSSFTVGFMWYGGLIGAIIFLIAYAKIRKLSIKSVMDLMTPFALMFDGIARFGCLFIGCCYGKEATWGFNYNGVTRLPSPMFESVLCFIILVQFLVWKPERKRPGILAPLYLLTYSIGRFVLEFFRGDESRGFFLFFSTSQWIALIIIITLITIFLISLLKKNISNILLQQTNT